MNIPRHITRAIRSWIAWRRRKQFMRELGVDDLATKFSTAKRQHKPTRKLERQLKEACTAKLKQELHHG
jgi:hypothetical protein|tara:strand:+ start:4617 stop:4823 length:207 start_codon:yes stop_codon:yes gene_type:complete